MTSKLQDWKDEKISQLEDQIEHMSVAIENSWSMAFAYKQEQEIERLRVLVGIESPDLDLDWNRLRSGDNRALISDHQDVFDMVAGMRAEIERLRGLLRDDKRE